MSTPNLHRRPDWARRLDPLAAAIARVLGRLTRRPSDSELTQLARQDRPSPPIAVPSARSLGIQNHLKDGRTAFAAGQYGEALHAFAQHTDDHPADAWGWHGRGDALQLLGSHSDALAAYDAAIDRSPSEPLHHEGRANALRSIGRQADAERAERRAASLRETRPKNRP